MKLWSLRIVMFVLMSIGVLVFMVWHTPQGLYSDSARPLKALQQYLNREVPTINHVQIPRADDLAQNTLGWIGYWPPGTQLFAFPLMAQGVSIGNTLRIISIACLIIGSVGWLRWFSLFNLPRWIGIVFAFSLPWMRYYSNSLFMYSAEILVYALAPWFLIAAIRLKRVWEVTCSRCYSIIFSALFGLGLGFAYIVKYSAVFISLGIIFYLGAIIFVKKLRLFYKTTSFQCSGDIYKGFVWKVSDFFAQKEVVSFVVIVFFFLAPVLTYNFINYEYGGYYNQIALKMKPNLKLENFLFLIGNPALAMTGGDSIWNYIFLHSDRGLLRGLPLIDSGSGESSLWIGLIGLPGGVLMLWLIGRAKIKGSPHLLAQFVFFVSITVQFCLWSFSEKAISYQARYLFPGGLAILPFFLEEGIDLWPKISGKISRTILLVAVFFYIIIPLLYGYISVIAKVKRTPKKYLVGPAQIYNPLLADVDLKSVRARLLDDFNPATDIWYISDPVSCLDIPGRIIFKQADFIDKSDLLAERYVTKKPLRVHVLLPLYFENNGKGAAIRSSFVQAHQWQEKIIEGSPATVWSAYLAP